MDNSVVHLFSYYYFYLKKFQLSSCYLLLRWKRCCFVCCLLLLKSYKLKMSFWAKIQEVRNLLVQIITQVDYMFFFISAVAWKSGRPVIFHLNSTVPFVRWIYKLHNNYWTRHNFETIVFFVCCPVYKAELL